MRMRRLATLRSSESGVISVGTVIALAIAALAIYLLLGATEGDSDHFGSVTVPTGGKVAVELESGETNIYYAEGPQPAGAPAFVPPTDLTYTVFDPEGAPVRVDSRGEDTQETDNGVTRLIGAFSAPEDGIYQVEAEAPSIGQRPMPELTFGQSPFEAIKARFGDVVDQLKGPTGILVLVALGLLALYPMAKRAVSD
jgi:hypothetical protein